MAGRWRIAEQVSEEAFDPGVQVALGALGYDFVDGAIGAGPGRAVEADLWIIDEESVDRIPRPTSGSLQPIVMLAREPGTASSDPRVVASLARPVSLRAIYGVLQSEVCDGLGGTTFFDRRFHRGVATGECGQVVELLLCGSADRRKII